MSVAQETLVRHQQTNVGPVPADWNVMSLTELADGKKELFDDGDWVEAKYLAKQGIRLIQTGNIGEGRFVQKEGSKRFISENSFNVLHCKDLLIGDLLICRLAEPAGRACVLPDLGEKRMITAVDVTIFRPRTEIADRTYLQNVFSTRGWFRAVDDRCGGSTRSRISRSALGSITIGIPELHEQHAIAEALGDVGALLDALDRLIAKKRALKQAAMQQLLTGRTRLPGFTGERPQIKLGTIAEFAKGFGLPKSALVPGGTEPCVHYGELFTQYGVSIDETISHTNITGGMVRSVLNDVLMPTSDVTPKGLAKACCILRDGVILGGDILIIRADRDQIDGTFLSYLIRYDAEQVLRLVTGSTVYHLYATDMRRFELALPSLNEQREIVGTLSDMDAEITALEARRAKTHAIKQAMMQELLTGRTRLVDLSTH